MCLFTPFSLSPVRHSTPGNMALRSGKNNARDNCAIHRGMRGTQYIMRGTGYAVRGARCKGCATVYAKPSLREHHAS
ncbi:hypothetical protein M404DRAFT_246372 [Pisolithus tinctorius Marx 270]|uniref:Uncharacterized protein n=1 Tax=Pisolithus tinctorius Marx 270 TaxID=870435 RepID=A0A0C3NLA8_PISTI|nr:hypothetical protein M404DRAFT_246372 [Pisolithus tinctorius Marx 270]